MRNHSATQKGFSLVEMLVVLVFTMILMAGMATVFKSSLSSFVTSGESISSSRRNRLAMDVLADDLNLAGQYLQLKALPSTIVDANPGFIVNPAIAFTGTDIPVADAVTDELKFYFDDSLTIAGTLQNPGGSGQNMGVATESSFLDNLNVEVKCSSDEEAKSIKAGMMIIPKGSYEVKTVVSASATGQVANLTLNESFDQKSFATDSVVVARFAQYVRYRIDSRNWDPENPSVGVPCLIREQGPYPGSGTFTPDAGLTTILAENVSRFTVELSADQGANWVRGANWQATKALLDAQLAGSGVAEYKTIGSSPHWYRYIPLLVRVNVTTRTAKQRAEYSPVGNTLNYKEQTQSLLLTPRHFGLPF